MGLTNSSTGNKVLSEELTERFNSGFIGQKLDVLFEEKSFSEDYIYEGYTRNYIRVKSKFDYDIIGDIINIDIVSKDGEVLIGK